MQVQSNKIPGDPSIQVVVVAPSVGQGFGGLGSGRPVHEISGAPPVLTQLFAPATRLPSSFLKAEPTAYNPIFTVLNRASDFALLKRKDRLDSPLILFLPAIDP
jgi:hypothetical protein